MKLTKMDIDRKEHTTDMDRTAKVPSRLVMDALRVVEKYTCRSCIRLSWGTCSSCQVSRVTDELVAALPAKCEETQR